MAYRSTNKAVVSAMYLLFWCSRDRMGVVVGAVEERLKEIIAGVTAEVGAQVIEVEVMPDQMHLRVEVAPTVGRSRLVMVRKGRSSRLLRRVFSWWRGAMLRDVWSRSWLVSTVGGPLEMVRRDVEHHKQAV